MTAKVLEVPDEAPFLMVSHALDQLPFDLVLTEDFNGEAIVTVYYTGWPIMLGQKNEYYDQANHSDQPYWWSYFETLGGYDEKQYRQVVIDFLFWIGELSEEVTDKFLESPMSYQDFQDAQEQGGEGHELIRFQEAVEEVVNEELAITHETQISLPRNEVERLLESFEYAMEEHGYGTINSPEENEDQLLRSKLNQLLGYRG